MEGKTCTKCGEWKVFGDFKKDKSKRDGYYSSCKACVKKYRQENAEAIKEYSKLHNKRYYQKNAEAVKECNKKYRQKNTEYYRQYHKKYRQENTEAIKQQRKRYYQENFELVNQRNKRYHQANAESIKRYRKQYDKQYNKQYLQTERGREANYRRNLKRKSYKHKVDFTPHERKQILDRDNWNCQSCGIEVHDRSNGDWNTPDKAHIDHIVPISKGGNSEPSNLQVLCRTCNLSKRDKLDSDLYANLIDQL